MRRQLKIGGICLQAQGVILITFAYFSIISITVFEFEHQLVSALGGPFFLIYGLVLLKVGVGVTRANLKYKKLGFVFGILCIFTRPGGIIIGPVSLLCQYLGRQHYEKKDIQTKFLAQSKQALIAYFSSTICLFLFCLLFMLRNDFIGWSYLLLWLFKSILISIIPALIIKYTNISKWYLSLITGAVIGPLAVCILFIIRKGI